ncbi:MAG: hypothetical protein WBC18_14605 [Ottowia sp.]|uniref:hypothetical protein n=1 Tax=Ottowia sp. TaxID=1898956 RepID=UPI003C70D740
MEDIAAKFTEPGDSRNLHTQLMAACDHDYLIYEPEHDVYRQGPEKMVTTMAEHSADDETAARLLVAVGEKPFLKVAARAAPSKTRKCNTESGGAAIDLGSKTAFEQQQVAAPFALAVRKKTMNNKAPLNLSTVKIESGIPLPEPGHEWRAFLAKFEIGDSAALPAQFLMKVRTAMKAQKTAGQGEYTSRTIDDSTIRVWRTA